MKNKVVAVGVCGGIAAYKVCELVSMLKKEGADVHVVMTKNATEFVAPLSYETLSNNRVIVDMFDRDFKWEVEHISLAKKADIFVVAPATANIIAKMATGIADDFLSTTIAAVKVPILVAPAMNTAMLSSDAVQQNIQTLKGRGVHFIDSQSGWLACGDQGKGRLAEPEAILQKIKDILYFQKDYAGKRILVSAGATVEDIDGVRFISNYSSGKMGLALAYEARDRGAEVVLVLGRISGECEAALKNDCKGIEIIKTVSTMDMYDAVLQNVEKSDIIIKAAAPADYRTENRAENKIKSEKLELRLIKNPDIAKAVGQKKGNKTLVIFSAETQNLQENSTKKLKEKNADLVVANDVTIEGAGFNSDTNVVCLITKDTSEALPKMTKKAVATAILDKILALKK